MSKIKCILFDSTITWSWHPQSFLCDAQGRSQRQKLKDGGCRASGGVLWVFAEDSDFQACGKEVSEHEVLRDIPPLFGGDLPQDTQFPLPFAPGRAVSPVGKSYNCWILSAAGWDKFKRKEVLHVLSHVQIFVTTQTVAQAPLSLGFDKQEYWRGLPFPPAGDLPDPGIEPMSPASTAFAGGFFTTEPPGKP